MTDLEVSNYMLLNDGKKICGRFKAKQPDRIMIHIPAAVMYSQTSFRKMFLLALLFSMGTSLLSCSDEAGNKQPIEQVVVSTQTTDTTDVVDIPPPPHACSGHIMGAIADREDSITPPREEIKFAPLTKKIKK